MKIKVTPVMAEANDIYILQILPGPLQAGQFTVAFVFGTYVITCIISNYSQLLICQCFPDMNRKIRLLTHLNIIFVTTNYYFAIHTLLNIK